MGKFISIPWATGEGNICIEYTGEGNGTLLVYSDAENIFNTERTQQVTVVTTQGSPQKQVILTIKQGAKENPYLLLEIGGHLLFENGEKIILENN